MSRFRIVVVLSIGLFGLIDAVALAGGGLNGPPGARGSRTTWRRTRTVNFIGPNDELRFGDPIPGLTPEQLARFRAGRGLFNAVYTAERGLGPIFNSDSCAGCHSAPVSGGAGTATVTRIGRFLDDGRFDPMNMVGGSVIQSRAISGECFETLPGRADVLALRITTPLFGAGLLEAIADETILAREDPGDADGDGISGRAHMVFDPYGDVFRVGRFGWKAQTATLNTYSAEASLNNLGITTRLFEQEHDPNGMLPPAIGDCDAVPDPEDAPDAEGVSDFERVADFQRFLAPPPRLPQLSGRGIGLFQRTGCTDCHVPVLFTRWSETEALSRQPVVLFSDLLLHDMDTAGDGVVQGDADATEMRTPPLWGLRARPRLWHDGRFGEPDTRVRDAIEGHEGEGTAARDAWLALPESDQSALLRFLDSI